MDINKFYSLRSNLLNSTFQVKFFKSDNLNENQKIEHHQLILGDYQNIKFPVIFEHESGNKLCDILDTGFAGLYLISEKTNKTFSYNNFTGWKTFPVRIFQKNGNEIFGYYGLSIVGRCGPIDYKKCQIIEKKLFSIGPPSILYKGLYIGLDKWDGTDFFLPEDFFGTIVTENVKKIIELENLTNIALTNLSEVETPDFAI